MGIWLFIGVFLSALLLMVICSGGSRFVKRRGDHELDPTEHRRRVDISAADAARMADARTPPFQGGGTIS
jgi:hypothetical protein